MIPKECKRLAEVDFPVAEVSRHAAREKSIRHGHPSTLHLWWARRPLASCRAVLLALLWPDPADPNCPETFKAKARELLPTVQGRPGPTDEDLRKALLKFIADFANWDLAAHPRYLEVARDLVRAAYPEEPPLVVDPFAGGGSIPLEALRVGCEAFASDLNPVACLILKVMLEDIPRHGPQLAEELRRVGAEIKKRAEQELADLYPKDPDGATPIAYLWARTVRCEAPNCGAEIPLVRSFWLAKKANRKRALRYRVERGDDGLPRVAFEVFEPKSEREVPAGTVSRARATCLCCGAVLPPERVRAQLAAQRGGADVVFEPSPFGRGQGEGVPRRIGGARLLAVVTLKPGEQGRHYRLPTERDYEAVRRAQQRLAQLLADWERDGKQGLCPVPDEPLPQARIKGNSGFRVILYGMSRWGDLFTARQKVALVTLARLIVGGPQNEEHREALSLALSKCGDFNSAISRWAVPRETSAATFGRQALPMVWDYCETIPTGVSTGAFDGALDYVAAFCERFNGAIGQVQPADAAGHPLPDETAHVWFTDPPYYDAIAYADLSDFFFVWLKRALPEHPLLRDPFDPGNPLTPKSREAVQDERSQTDDGRPKDRAFYEEAMARAFAEGRRVLRDDGVGSVVFAHKTTEGWEALLSGLIKGGWTITGSWPIATERPGRLLSQESAALATSVHLVCRPRPEDAPVGDWADVLRELPNRVGEWMERLQAEGIRGADLVFACIGPALEIFSRYSRVETAEGREVTLAQYLERVWEVVGRKALEQVLGTGNGTGASAGVLEEDARLTALFLWTLQTSQAGNGAARETEPEAADDTWDEEEDEDEGAPVARGRGYALVYDVVRRFAQPMGIDLAQWERRVIETEKGVVRLLTLNERAKVLFGKNAPVEFSPGGRSAERQPLQGRLFDVEAPGVPAPRPARGRPRKSGPDRAPAPSAAPTTLDRVHTAMLLQKSGNTEALKQLLAEAKDRGPEFLRLANALSALYPQGSEEKRLLDAMLLAVPK